MGYTKEDIIRIVKEEDINFIRMQFTDIFGQLKNVAITASQIEKALNNQITLDGYKVAGFIPVCNSLLEDTVSNLDLASWIIEMISEAIGLAEDKAILYGKGSAAHMPLGIVTRLAQENKPSDYPANAPAWVDLHTTNIQKINGDSMTGAEFWSALTIAPGAENGLLRNTHNGDEVYFVHSFQALPVHAGECAATVEYGGHTVCAAVERGRVTGFQFHPEKSGPVGLAMLQAFVDSL